MKWVFAWRRTAPAGGEQPTAGWEADRRDDADLDAVELSLPVATPVVFRGLDQQMVLTRALAWLQRYGDDFRIVGMAWWTDEARDPRQGRAGERLLRYSLTVHVIMGGPAEELDWGRAE